MSNPAGNDPTPAAPPAPETDKTFTQADVDRVVAERLARTERKYSDYEDIRAKAARLDELEAASASDLDKAVAAARKEVETALRAEFATERVADKIEALSAGKFADSDDAKLHLGPKSADFVKDGAVDTKAIESAIAALLEAKPHLAKPAETPKTPPAPSRVGLGVTGDAKSEGSVSPGLGRLAAAYASTEK